LSWFRYSLVEPFGWAEREYHTAANLAMLYNINRKKRTRAKRAADFMRNMTKRLRSVKTQEQAKKRYQEMSIEQKREYVKAQFTGWIRPPKKGRFRNR
jgi:hypothetical protein